MVVMDIQYVFYWLASITMAMGFVFLLGMVILLFYIKKKVKDLDSYVKYMMSRVEHIIESVDNQVKTVASLRTSILGKIFK